MYYIIGVYITFCYNTRFLTLLIFLLLFAFLKSSSPHFKLRKIHLTVPEL